MDKQEAKRMLQALRPNDRDVTLPAFAEALAQIENDPELKAWWEAQRAFDARVAAKLGEVPLPSDLRGKILAERKIVPFAPQPHLSVWLAAAAAVAILCAVGTSYYASLGATRHISTARYSETALAFLGNDAPALAMTSSDHEKITRWLKAQNAPMGTIPAGMAGLPTVGCQKYVVKGHSVSLICFALAGGGIAHLFVIEQDALSDPPGGSGPHMKQVGSWSTASWSDGKMSYMLATQAGPDALRQLL